MGYLKLVAGLSVLFLMLLVAVLLRNYIFEEENREPTIKCEKWNSEELGNAAMSNDGSITSNGVTYQTNEVYKDGNVSRGCKCLKSLCVRKCCALDHVYEVYVENEDAKVRCKLNESKAYLLSQLKYYEYTSENMPTERIVPNISIVIEELRPNCPDELLTYKEENVILTNGSLLSRRSEKKGYQLNTINEYCIEFVNEEILYFTCLHQPNKPSIDPREIKLMIFSVCMLITLPFLIVTFLVYYFVPDLHNLVGKSLSSLTFSKIISYILLILVQQAGNKFGQYLCVPIGYLLQYSLMASFFWLNVMCFDIWLVFKENRPQRSMTKDAEARRFMKYSIYAWGMPAVLCLITFIADEYMPEISEFKPNIGNGFCLINTENKSKIVFYFLPLTVLLILNIAMFLTTATKIFLHKKQMAKLKSGGKKITNQKDKERLNLYFKLFLIMGITWVTEPVSSIFEEKPDWLWVLLDASNLLLGIMIFVIFVCKQRTLKTITAKLCPSKNYFNKCNSSSNTASTKTDITVAPACNLNKEITSTPEENGTLNMTDAIEMKTLANVDKY